MAQALRAPSPVAGDASAVGEDHGCAFGGVEPRSFRGGRLPQRTSPSPSGSSAGRRARSPASRRAARTARPRCSSSGPTTTTARRSRRRSGSPAGPSSTPSARLESAGGVAALEARARRPTPGLPRRPRRAEDAAAAPPPELDAARPAGAPRVDGGASLATGIGGVAPGGGLKCLHAHAAVALAVGPYALGDRVLERAGAALPGALLRVRREVAPHRVGPARLGGRRAPPRAGPPRPDADVDVLDRVVDAIRRELARRLGQTYTLGELRRGLRGARAGGPATSRMRVAPGRGVRARPRDRRRPRVRGRRARRAGLVAVPDPERGRRATIRRGSTVAACPTRPRRRIGRPATAAGRGTRGGARGCGSRCARWASCSSSRPVSRSATRSAIAPASPATADRRQGRPSGRGDANGGRPDDHGGRNDALTIVKSP